MHITETRDAAANADEKGRWSRIWNNGRFLALGPLSFAVIQGVCAAAVFLSGIRTALGFSSLIAATAAGPATGLHANKIRIPMLAAAVVGATLNLLLYWNSERLRRNPSARWRLRPATRRERIRNWIQIGTSVVTLLLVLAEVLAHPLFHREM